MDVDFHWKVLRIVCSSCNLLWSEQNIYIMQLSARKVCTLFFHLFLYMCKIFVYEYHAPVAVRWYDWALGIHSILWLIVTHLGEIYRIGFCNEILKRNPSDTKYHNSWCRWQRMLRVSSVWGPCLTWDRGGGIRFLSFFNIASTACNALIQTSIEFIGEGREDEMGEKDIGNPAGLVTLLVSLSMHRDSQYLNK